MTNKEMIEKINALSKRIDTYTCVVHAECGRIRDLITTGDFDWAIEKATGIARHLARIPEMQAEIRSLRSIMNRTEAEK